MKKQPTKDLDDYTTQCSKLYPELDWNMKKYKHLPEEFKDEIKEYYSQLIQYMDSAMWDMNDAMEDQTDFQAKLSNSETNADSMQPELIGITQQMERLREWCHKQEKTDIEQFVDGKAVNRS